MINLYDMASRMSRCKCDYCQTETAQLKQIMDLNKSMHISPGDLYKYRKELGHEEILKTKKMG